MPLTFIVSHGLIDSVFPCFYGLAIWKQVSWVLVQGFSWGCSQDTDWGWRICFQDGSLTCWLLAGGFISSSTCSCLRVLMTRKLASSRVSDPRELARAAMSLWPSFGVPCHLFWTVLLIIQVYPIHPGSGAWIPRSQTHGGVSLGTSYHNYILLLNSMATYYISSVYSSLDGGKC